LHHGETDEDEGFLNIGDQNLRFIAQELVKTIRQNVTIDWTEKQSVRVMRLFGTPWAPRFATFPALPG